jgi:hypothetical protein
MRHSMAWPRRIWTGSRRISRGLAGGDADLALHQIDAGDHFGDRMLHLNARVHFDEVQIAARRPSGTRRCRRWCSRWLSSSATRSFRRCAARSSGSRRSRALPRSASDAGAGWSTRARPESRRCRAVAQHLKLDVRGFSTSFSMYISPQENAAAASACACASSGWHFLGAAHDAHAAPAAAGRGFEHHRIADAAGDPSASSTLLRIPFEPGRIGTPASSIAARAICFSPCGGSRPAWVR